jgi:hypothetical protein
VLLETSLLGIILSAWATRDADVRPDGLPCRKGALEVR